MAMPLSSGVADGMEWGPDPDGPWAIWAVFSFLCYAFLKTAILIMIEGFVTFVSFSRINSK